MVDPSTYHWNDDHWAGNRLPGQILYEMHIGTFTREGTYRAAMAEIPRLAELGVTILEVMPVAEFDGSFGWGYDGVDFFAPTRLYGTPDDFRRFVDTAHQHGLGVMLDVVYNHFGPAATTWASSPTLSFRSGIRPNGATRSISTAKARGLCASSSP